MRVSRTKFAILVAMSIVGVLASTYVLIIFNALRQLPYGCPSKPTGWINCQAVLESKYGQFMGVPLELFAVAYFVVSLFLIYLVVFGKDTWFRYSLSVLFFWRFLGVPLVFYLIGIEVFMIHAICLYCSIMHAAILIDFCIISYFLYSGTLSPRMVRPEKKAVLDREQPKPQ